MRHRVVVLGAGYAGLPAAKRLARQVRPDEVDVVLISARPSFVERPRLHQLATGQRLRDIDLARFTKGSGVRLKIGQVTEIDLVARRLVVDAKDHEYTVDYDILVYALGSTSEVDAVSGVRENAFDFSGTEASARLHRHMSTVDGPLVVCGGGLTGIESAAEFAESYPGLRVELVTAGAVGGWLTPRARAYIDRSFHSLGVRVHERALVEKVLPDRLALTDGSEIPFATCLWAGGFTVPKLARESGLTVDGRGRIVTDELLRSVSHPDVYAIGDAAAVPGVWGSALAMGCRSGGFTGPQVADIIAARLAGKNPPPFRFRYIHECISLGRKRAVVQFLKRDETPKKSILTGWLAMRYKEIVLSSAVLLFRWSGPYRPHRRISLATR